MQTNKIHDTQTNIYQYKLMIKKEVTIFIENLGEKRNGRNVKIISFVIPNNRTFSTDHKRLLFSATAFINAFDF